jgi:hypothetical protein
VRSRGTEVTQLTHCIAQRTAHYLERQGLLVRDAENGYLTADAAVEENENAMNYLLGSSISILKPVVRAVVTLK